MHIDGKNLQEAMDRMNDTVREQLAKLGVPTTTSLEPVIGANGKPVMGSDGKPVMRRVTIMGTPSDDARELLEVFNLRTPCWFKGCEGLRRQYHEEVSASDCSGCTGKTRRKYMALARKLLDADPDRTVPRLH